MNNIKNITRYIYGNRSYPLLRFCYVHIGNYIVHFDDVVAIAVPE